MQQELHANEHRWQIVRRDRSFQVFVVEPASFYSDDHIEIFKSALSAIELMPAENIEINTGASPIAPARGMEFDLVVFPEAFLAREFFVQVVQGLARLQRQGLVHVGLRPSSFRQSHLFPTKALKEISLELRMVDNVALTDLDQFDRWVATRVDGEHFNIGCLFGIDAEGVMRICLHAKMVAADVEVRTIPEDNVTEANLLTVITLIPTDTQFKKVTIQPLICSDAVEKSSLVPTHKPLQAMAVKNESLSQPPDEVDIVSVVTCTPQPALGPDGSFCKQRWHQAFRTTFENCAKSDSYNRHQFATFILANYRAVPDGRSAVDKEIPGGLSGTYFPRRFADANSLQDYVVLSVYGRPKGDLPDDFVWGNMRSTVPTNEQLEGVGALLGLSTLPGDENCSAFMLGFRLNKLPRDSGHSVGARPITGIQRWTRASAKGNAFLKFRAT